MIDIKQQGFSLEQFGKFIAFNFSEFSDQAAAASFHTFFGNSESVIYSQFKEMMLGSQMTSPRYLIMLCKHLRQKATPQQHERLSAALNDKPKLSFHDFQSSLAMFGLNNEDL